MWKNLMDNLKEIFAANPDAVGVDETMQNNLVEFPAQADEEYEEDIDAFFKSI